MGSTISAATGDLFFHEMMVSSTALREASSAALFSVAN
jgi:hypothetical protein